MPCRPPDNGWFAAQFSIVNGQRAFHQDLVQLQFDFSSLKGKRTPHPGYVPGALLTLTIWIWVNGPIYVDKYDLAAELQILDNQGRQLALSQKNLVVDKNTGLWDYDYMFPSGGQQLTELVEQLLQDGTRQLTH